MAPVPSWRNPGQAEKPPSNLAQMGMGFNIFAGTIDLGLQLVDAIFMIGDWIRHHKKAHAVKVKAEEIQRRGREKPTSRHHRRSITLIE